MNIRTFETEAFVNQAAANTIAGLLLTKPKATLGLATGGTPLGIYEQLVSMYRRGQVSFSQAVTYNLDEYVGLPPEHPQSYFFYMNHHLFKHVDCLPGNIHIPNGVAADLHSECRRYDALTGSAGQLDLQLLGIGHNGHIGFNEPAKALTQGTHLVDLSEETRLANARFFDSLDEVPTQAITMGIGTILKAKTILLVVKGADKADILRRALYGPITTDCPASLLQTHPNLIVLADQAAGGAIHAS